ncbi:PhzF family phenazine biosynthesis protein [Cohnella sp. GCM10027633]|uniref:PhzF family phenazine biosynthesis protein n=1 Tax=unclassified Cohnella TaxID=2636738 RepID=UPI00363564B0
MKVIHYDAFADVPNLGNPAGIVLDADELGHEEMQAIARRVGFNETVFVRRSGVAEAKLTYYTPGHEINLCGHATIASLSCLRDRGMIDTSRSLTIETNVGILPISFEGERGEFVRMKQDVPRFVPFSGDADRLMRAMGLRPEERDDRYPIVYGSTGTWTLLVPVRSLEAFARMKPANRDFPDILVENPKASVHPFGMETLNAEALMHARHFSSPYSGTVEDPVTGTASGVMGAYYLTYMQPDLASAAFVVEQGQEIGRDGRVRVEAYKREGQGMDVYVAGTAVFVKEMEV